MEVHEVASIETCYAEKFGVPRQSGVVGSAWGKIIFTEKYQSADFIRGLEGFSHLWLVFVFHESISVDANGEATAVKATVRPPRLGGNERVGVFASRSPFRPNPIGLSLVKIESIERSDTKAGEGCVIHVSGVDLVSGTPLLDIKPYIPYCDSVLKDEAGELRSGYVKGRPEVMPVEWARSDENHDLLDDGVKLLIEETLSVDPRPAYHDDAREYGCLIGGVNVRWKVERTASAVHNSDKKVIKILSCESTA